MSWPGAGDRRTDILPSPTQRTNGLDLIGLAACVLNTTSAPCQLTTLVPPSAVTSLYTTPFVSVTPDCVGLSPRHTSSSWAFHLSC